jgi:hypothetical protein
MKSILVPNNLDIQTLIAKRHNRFAKYESRILYFLYVLHIHIFLPKLSFSSSVLVASTTKSDLLKNIITNNNNHMSSLFSGYRNLQSYNKRNRKLLFVQISRTQLIKWFSAKKYKQIIDFLLSEHIIETDNRYIVGLRCKSYRLTAKYAFADWSGYSINNKREESKIMNIEEETVEQTDPYILGMTELNKNVGIYSDLFNWYEWETNHKQKKESEPLEEKMMHIVIAMNAINAGVLSYTKGSNGGRIFSTFTSLPKEADMLLYDKRTDKRLVQLDCSCFHPYLLSNEYPNPTSNVLLFQQHCLDGSLYDRIVADTNVKREQVKKSVLIGVLYGQEYPHRTSKVKKYFIITYPDVYHYINQYNSSQLAITLQSAESNIFIGVSKQLLSENILHITKHDAIFVDENYVQHTKDLLIQACKEKYNNCPIIKEK